jgi:glucokinase
VTGPATDAPVIGIDLGGTNLQFGVHDGARVIGRARGRTEAAEGLDRVVDNLVAGAQRAAEDASLSMRDVAAIGIAAAGAIDIPNGVVLFSPNLGWEDVPLRDFLQTRLGRPVNLDNDVNGAVWGEDHAGAGPGRGDALGVWVGTGIGGGLIFDGRLHHGALFTAGEIGHTVMDVDGAPGARTVEDFCSRTGMRRRIAERLGEHRGSIVHERAGGDPDRVGTKTLADGWSHGDELVTSVLREAARRLGIAIANQVTMLATDCVIVGGGITEALGEPWLELVRESFRENVVPDRSRACRVVMTKLAADAGLIGAALLARDAI